MIFLPDDIDRVFWGSFETPGLPEVSAPPEETGEAGGSSTPIRRVVCRKPGTPEGDLTVPVWWFSHEMRHRVEKEYPAIYIQSLGPQLVLGEAWGLWVDEVKQVLEDGSLVTRQAPLWYDMTYQVTCAARTWQLIHEVTWDVQNGVFPWKFGTRFITLDLGIARRIIMFPRGIQYQEDPHVYRSTQDFTLRVPLFVDGVGSANVVVEKPIEDVCIFLRNVGQLEDITSAIEPAETTVLKFVKGEEELDLAELGERS